MGQLEYGNRFGKLSFTLYDRFKNRNFLARFYAVYYDGVHSWMYPVQESIKPLMYAHKVGLETGDNEFAMVRACCFFPHV
jgi:predicted ATPase